MKFFFKYTEKNIILTYTINVCYICTCIIGVSIYEIYESNVDSHGFKWFMWILMNLWNLQANMLC